MGRWEVGGEGESGRVSCLSTGHVKICPRLLLAWQDGGSWQVGECLIGVNGCKQGEVHGAAEAGSR